MSQKLSKNDSIIEFNDYFWILHKQHAQISTNMPRIGQIIRKIGENWGILTQKLQKTDGQVLSVNLKKKGNALRQQ